MRHTYDLFSVTRRRLCLYRKYIERENERSIKLYIRYISAEDGGKYTCSTSFQDHVMDEVTEIILYGKILSYDLCYVMIYVMSYVRGQLLMPHSNLLFHA